MSYRNKMIAALAALAVLRLLYILYTPFALSPDEAHYWEWARRLGLSYYSKGPLVAYVIAFFTALLGDTAFAVRTGAVIFSALASYMLYLFGRDVFKSEQVGFYGALLINATPLFSAGSILMTTDMPFIFFWAVALYSINRAISEEGGPWWYLTGLAIGLGFLAKYTMVLLYPCILLFLLFVKGERRWLKRPGPYAAALISLVLASPVIIWNHMNGYVTIRHTMGQAHVGSSAYSAYSALEFLGSQLALITPILMIAVVYAVWQCAKSGTAKKESGLLLVAFASAPLFLFFLIKSLHGKVQGNWAAASYTAAMPAIVWAYMNAYNRRGAPRRLLKTLAYAGVLMSVVVTLAVHFPWTLAPPGAMGKPPFSKVTGWSELGERVSVVASELEEEGDTFIMSDRYQIASELAFYVKGNPVTYNVNTGSRRMNQYDLWPGFERHTGSNAVYVSSADSSLDGVVAKAFDTCDKELFVVYAGTLPMKEFSIFRCRGFKGMERAAEVSY